MELNSALTVTYLLNLDRIGSYLTFDKVGSRRRDVCVKSTSRWYVVKG